MNEKIGKAANWWQQYYYLRNRNYVKW